jgi:hypothetical protein
LFGKSVLGSLLDKSKNIDYIFLFGELKGINFVLLMDELGSIYIGGIDLVWLLNESTKFYNIIAQRINKR